MQKPVTFGDSPPPRVTNCWIGSGSWPTRRMETLEMRLRLQSGDVEPIHLGVTLPDFGEWALPYILIEDEDTDWAGWHKIEGLKRVCHTQELPDHAQRPVHFLLPKTLQKAQTYPNPPPPPGQPPTAL